MSGLLAIIFLIVSVMWLIARMILSFLYSGGSDMNKLSSKVNKIKTSKWAEKL